MIHVQLYVVTNVLVGGWSPIYIYINNQRFVGLKTSAVSITVISSKVLSIKRAVNFNWQFPRISSYLWSNVLYLFVFNYSLTEEKMYKKKWMVLLKLGPSWSYVVKDDTNLFHYYFQNIHTHVWVKTMTDILKEAVGIITLYCKKNNNRFFL